MKYIVAIFTLLSCSIACMSQHSEFTKSGNGLIYPDTTISQLKFIVDSLNLKYKVCELNKIYRAKSQAKAHFVAVEKMNVKAAKQDIAAGISVEDFIKKYPNATVEKDLLVVKHRYKTYDEKDVTSFQSVGFDNDYDHTVEFDKYLSYYERPLKRQWIINYSSKTEYSPESLEAFYFLEDFIQQPLPEKYARMVQYADCMVDTGTQIFYNKRYRGRYDFDRKETPRIKAFLEYADKMKIPAGDDEGNLDNSVGQSDCDEAVKTPTSANKVDQKFLMLLNTAIKEAEEKGGSDDDLEDYVAQYYSKKAALELKRHRRVVGMCSQDDSPRRHALNIAKLSAESVSWETFLRAHLDIMNDRFDRVSDGSYAWAARKTYIKELEVLDINVQDLLLGICLRVENAGDNHYYGNIGRLGRALSETQQANIIESKMLEMIADHSLDDYNRILMYYLFFNYNYNLDNKEKQTQNRVKLIAAVQKLPSYLSGKIKIEN